MSKDAKKSEKRKSDLYLAEERPPRREVLRRVAALMAIIIASLSIWLWLAVPPNLKLPIWLYTITLLGWVMTRIDASWIGFASVLAMALLGEIKQEQIANILGTEVVWFMIGAFVVSEALTQSGLAKRLVSSISSSAKSVWHLCWLLTGWLILAAFLVPSTTSRAALALPLVRSLDGHVDLRVTRCLELLIPAVVLIGTTTTLTGAASHMLANDLLIRFNYPSFSFTQWLILAGSFGVVASIMTALLWWQRLGLHL